MCGIAGIFAYSEAAPPVDRTELLCVRDSMSRRGPDGEGLWISPDLRVGLAHRRLAIIDLSNNGAQPMSAGNGRYWITFNGEIYNYRALRRDLETRGFAFRSESDTEVLLQLYADRGAEMVHSLRGMYTFAIWDSREHTLFLARDPFGIKPLYYAGDRGTFRFASQVKALLRSEAIDRRHDPAGSVGFLIWGAVPDPFTLYREIRALPAGCTLTVRRNHGAVIRKFFDIREELVRAKEAHLATESMQEIVAAAVRDSVRHHLVADVPVGVFLSSGIDSSTVVAVAAKEGTSKLHTLTLGFKEFSGSESDETPLAETVARRYETRHETHWITRNEFLRDYEAILDAMDQPSTDGVNTYLVSKAAAAAGMKVAMSGIGGDELFGGYPSFSDVPKLANWLGFSRGIRPFGRCVRAMAAPLLRRITSPKFASILEYGGTYGGAYLLRRSLFLPWELDDILGKAEIDEGLARLDTINSLGASARDIRSPRAVVAALEMQWYMRNQLLRDSDWAGMAHSIEIRTPLVDVTLFRTLAPFLFSPAPPSKRTLASIPQSLPSEIIERSKTGFTVPVREWTSEMGKGGTARGLRGWALRVMRPRSGGRVLAMVSDAFGGDGGIALYNRDLLSALCELPEVHEVKIAARLMPNEPEPMPGKLHCLKDALGGKYNFATSILREILFGRKFHLIFCCHINLLPLARLAKWLTGAPVVLWIYGIDAWTRSQSGLVRSSLSAADFVVAISNVTAERFAGWSGIDRSRISVLPNAVHLEWYGAGFKDEHLVDRYGLRGKRVVMTMGRLVSAERYKGIDEVLNILPSLVEKIPNLKYMIIGEGSDRSRLEAKATKLGITDHVVFAGFVPEKEKAAHFRLADLYVMPSRGEGFGFVLLEAMACGVQVIASSADGTREAVRDGLLGRVVDPDAPSELVQAICEGIGSTNRGVPAGLEHFGFPNFKRRFRQLVLQGEWL